MIFTYIFEYIDSETVKETHVGMEQISVVSHLPIYEYRPDSDTMLVNSRYLILVDDMAINLMMFKHSDDPQFKILSGHRMERKDQASETVLKLIDTSV